MKAYNAMKNDGYFLYHSIGQYPQKDEDLAVATSKFAQIWSAVNDQQWDYLLGQRAEFIALWSQLIGAQKGTVTSCENVTQGVHTLITSLPANLLHGRKVLVSEDCFPSNHFLLSSLQQRLGFELDTVSIRQGASWVDEGDFIAQWDEDVALALITWVSSTTSYKSDLNRLVQHGRKMGSIIGVDITQAAGLLPYNVNEPNVDFVVSTSLKWICGTPGAGMLYVQPELIANTSPEIRGWFSQGNPFNWDLDKFEFADDIRRFDNGTPSCLSAAATVPALKWHAGLDKAQLLAHNRHLSEVILNAVDKSELQLISPRDEKERGGSVMVKLKTADDAHTFIEKLRKHGLYADCRGSILRISPGIMTSVEAAEMLGNLLTQHTH